MNGVSVDSNAGSPLLAGIELGGTKCVCILGTGPEDIRAEVRVPTTGPGETLAALSNVLDSWQGKRDPLRALGIASFGPLDLRPASKHYGRITTTVKPGWDGTDIVGTLANGRGIPVGFNTDVNGAALAEGRWGAARGLEDFAYITVGTGVGVGLVVGGRTVLGCNHTELGHLRISREAGDRWPGVCQFHGDCVEGLASGPAIEARAGLPANEISADSPVWESAAYALAQLTQALLLATAPRRILVGGGVVQSRPGLFEQVRRKLAGSINGYLDLEELTGGINRYVVPPGLGAMSGPLGSLALAADAYVGIARRV